MSDRPEEVDELISGVAEKWGYNEGTIEDTLLDLGIDPDDVSEEKAKAAYEAFEGEDKEEFVSILKDISETPGMVEAFRAKFLEEEDDTGGDFEHQTQTQQVETDVPDAPESEVPDEESELREYVAELTGVVQQQSEAIKDLNDQLRSAVQGGQSQQSQAPAPAQQGGGGGMLDMSPQEVELLKMVGNIVRSNNEPNPWAERMQDMQEQMFVAQMKQLEAQTGETPGQKLGRKFDDQLAEEALKGMDISFSGGSGSSDGSDASDNDE